MPVSDYVNNYVVVDGGLGTTLMEAAKDRPSLTVSHEASRLWGSQYLYTDKDLVINSHFRFLQAGANVIQTNTYQANVETIIKAFELSVEESLELMQRSVLYCQTAIYKWKALSDQNLNTTILIGGCIGPYGATLKDMAEFIGGYLSSMSVEALKDWHRPRIQSLVSGGVDLLQFDTIPGLKEMQALIELLKEFPNVSAWMSTSSLNGKTLGSGESFSAMVELVNRCDQLIGIGLNCICPRESVKSIIETYAATLDPKKVIVACLNSFEDYNEKRGWFTDGDDESIRNFEGRTLDQLEAGAKWIGGCCRVTPENISEIAVVVKKYAASKKISTCN